MRLHNFIFRHPSNIAQVYLAVFVKFLVPFACDLVNVEVVADRLDLRSWKPVAPNNVWYSAYDLMIYTYSF